jgi:hypothetical protein
MAEISEKSVLSGAKTIKINGGRRPGAGRKPGVIVQLRKLALANSSGEAEKSLAMMVNLRDHSKNESIQFAAAKEIMDRVWGKPRQTQEITEKPGRSIVMEDFQKAITKVYGSN